MEVSEAIVHLLQKEQGSAEVTRQPRNELSNIDGNMTRLATTVLELYQKTSNLGYGTFDPDESTYRFSPLLKEYVASQKNLVEFSQAALNIVASRMGEQLFATGGYMLVVRFSHSARDWLLIVMLKLKPGTGIDPATLDLNGTDIFDVDRLHEAARIDLTKWQSTDNTGNYVSFAKARVGGQDISRYFRNALGCTDYNDSKHNTEKLIDAVNRYIGEMEPIKKKEIKQKTYDYCLEKHKSGEPFSLEALSMRLSETEPQAFINYVRRNEADFAISDGFRPHQKTFSRFKRIFKKWKTISLAFDVEDLANGSIRLDQTNNAITISSIPEDLKTEIMRHQGS